MQTGKQVVNIENGSIANFYFDEEGVMKTGKQSIFDEDLGEVQNWYFHTDGSRKGQGYHGIKDNVLYVYGLRQEADKDLRLPCNLRRQAVPGKMPTAPCRRQDPPQVHANQSWAMASRTLKTKMIKSGP